MTEESSQTERKIKKLIIIILCVVVPTLIVFSVILGTNIISIKAVTPMDVLKSTEVKCYNINWFGTEGTGFQVVYKDSADEILSKLKNTGKIVDESFFEEDDVVKYFVNTCPHLNNRDEIPEEFDPNIGVKAIDKCIERKHSAELCIELIS